jgi:hypothetical protein
MKRPSVGRAVLFAATLAAAPAHAGIEHLYSCGTEWGGNTVGISRGINNDVTVEGFGVDLATSVDSTLPNTPVTVLSRKNGAGSNIVIRIAPPAVGDRIFPASVVPFLRELYKRNVDVGPSALQMLMEPATSAAPAQAVDYIRWPSGVE